MQKKSKNKNIIFHFLDNVISVILSIFHYAFLGLKCCTINLFKKEKMHKITPKELKKLEKEAIILANDLKTMGATRSKTINTYYYKALKNGYLFKGKMKGSSKLDINSFLVNEGFTVYSIKTNNLINILNKDMGSNKLSSKELVFFLTELSTFLKAGISLNESIKMISREVKNKRRKEAYQTISFDLSLGTSFSQSLEKQEGMFPNLLINMIKSSEATGNLTETLDELAKYYEEVEKSRKDTISALTYPTIIFVFSIFVIIFILTFIMPEFIKIYKDSKIELNPFTKFIINASNYLQIHLVTIILTIIFLIIIFILLYKNIKSFKEFIQKLLMHIPIIKDIIIYHELSIITKTFSSLLKNNVYITESMDILKRITNNEIYKDIIDKTVNNITKGEKISSSFKDHWAIPEVCYMMLKTGEDTGSLAEMMGKISNYYQELHHNLVKNIKVFIEPVLIAFLTIVVGGILIAVIVPMFEMYGGLMK